MAQRLEIGGGSYDVGLEYLQEQARQRQSALQAAALQQQAASLQQRAQEAQWSRDQAERQFSVQMQRDRQAQDHWQQNNEWEREKWGYDKEMAAQSRSDALANVQAGVQRWDKDFGRKQEEFEQALAERKRKENLDNETRRYGIDQDTWRGTLEQMGHNYSGGLRNIESELRSLGLANDPESQAYRESLGQRRDALEAKYQNEVANHYALRGANARAGIVDAAAPQAALPKEPVPANARQLRANWEGNEKTRVAAEKTAATSKKNDIIELRMALEGLNPNDETGLRAKIVKAVMKLDDPEAPALSPEEVGSMVEQAQASKNAATAQATDAKNKRESDESLTKRLSENGELMPPAEFARLLGQVNDKNLADSLLTKNPTLRYLKGLEGESAADLMKTLNYLNDKDSELIKELFGDKEKKQKGWKVPPDIKYVRSKIDGPGGLLEKAMQQPDGGLEGTWGWDNPDKTPRTQRGLFGGDLMPLVRTSDIPAGEARARARALTNYADAAGGTSSSKASYVLQGLLADLPLVGVANDALKGLALGKDAVMHTELGKKIMMAKYGVGEDVGVLDVLKQAGAEALKAVPYTKTAGKVVAGAGRIASKVLPGTVVKALTKEIPVSKVLSKLRQKVPAFLTPKGAPGAEPVGPVGPPRVSGPPSAPVSTWPEPGPMPAEAARAGGREYPGAATDYMAGLLEGEQASIMAVRRSAALAQEEAALREGVYVLSGKPFPTAAEEAQAAAMLRQANEYAIEQIQLNRALQAQGINQLPPSFGPPR